MNGQGNGNGEQAPAPPPIRIVEKGKRTDTVATLSHLIVVMTVLVLAAALRLEHELDTPTIGTVFGAAMGYATGLTVQKGKNGE